MQNNSLGRLLSVFVQPTQTFQSIAARPTWIIALIVTSLLSLAAMAVIVPKIDWEQNIRKSLAESAVELDAEQIESQIEVVEKFGGATAYVWSGMAPWLFFPIVALLFWGLFRMVGGQLSFSQSLAVTAHGYLPGLLKLLLSLPVVWRMSTLDVDAFQSGGFLLSNLGFLAGDEATDVVRALLTSADVFSLWTLVLLVIGFTITAKVSRGTAVLCVGCLWSVGVGLKVVLALVGQVFG